MSIIQIPAETDTTELDRSELLALEVNDSEMEDAYAEMLDEIYGMVQICGLEYDAARALRTVDPIAYRCGFADYVSAYYVEVNPEDFPPVKACLQDA